MMIGVQVVFQVLGALPSWGYQIIYKKPNELENVG